MVSHRSTFWCRKRIEITHQMTNVRLNDTQDKNKKERERIRRSGSIFGWARICLIVPRRSQRMQLPSAGGKDGDTTIAPNPTRRPVGDRWSYGVGLPASVPESTVGQDEVSDMEAAPTQSGTMGSRGSGSSGLLSSLIGEEQTLSGAGEGYRSNGAALTSDRAREFPGTGEESHARVCLGITLTFPDGERCDQRYSAHPGWTVPQLRDRMAVLLRTNLPVCLNVSPDWEELDHLGPISIRFFPGSTTPCPCVCHNSVVRVRQCPPWAGGLTPPEPLLRLTLTFLDGELEDQQHWVHPRMTVPQLQRMGGDLLRTRNPIVLAVSPDWEEVHHSGSVRARVFPGSAVPCPYLGQNSIVQVRQRSPLGPDATGESSDVCSQETRPSKRFSDSSIPDPQLPLSDEIECDVFCHVTPSERHQLCARFKKESKRARSQFKEQLVMEWHQEFPAMGDKENLGSDHLPGLTTAGPASGFDDDEYAFDCFVGARLAAHDRWAFENETVFLSSIRSKPPTPSSDQATNHSKILRHERIQAFWDRSKRKYFGETEGENRWTKGPTPSSRETTVGDEDAFRGEVPDARERPRRRRVLVPGSPSPSLGARVFNPDDSLPDPTIEMSRQSRSNGSTPEGKEPWPR
jgi:hypothetical protein